MAICNCFIPPLTNVTCDSARVDQSLRYKAQLTNKGIMIWDGFGNYIGIGKIINDDLTEITGQKLYGGRKISLHGESVRNLCAEIEKLK